MRDLAKAGFWLPLLRAFGTGLFVGLFTLGLGYALNWSESPAIALMLGAAGALISWLSDWGVFHALVQWLHEPRIVTPMPVMEPARIVQIPVTMQDGRTTQILRFAGVSEANLKRLVDELSRGASFTNAYWDPRITRAEFETFRSELIKRGWAEQIRSDPQGGYRLTDLGREGLRTIAAKINGRSPSPTAEYANYERI